jgi:hypothetical protein
MVHIIYSTSNASLPYYHTVWFLRKLSHLGIAFLGKNTYPISGDIKAINKYFPNKLDLAS